MQRFAILAAAFVASANADLLPISFINGASTTSARPAATTATAPLVSAKSCSELRSSGRAFSTQKADTNGSPLVCGASRVTSGTNNPAGPSCSNKVPYDDAVKMCTAIGARLCTAAELTAGEAAKSGCDLDFHRVWSGSSSLGSKGDCPGNSVVTQAGSPQYATTLSAQCTPKTSFQFVRCCADACPDVCANDPCNSKANEGNVCSASVRAGTGSMSRQFPISQPQLVNSFPGVNPGSVFPWAGSSALFNPMVGGYVGQSAGGFTAQPAAGGFTAQPAATWQTGALPATNALFGATAGLATGLYPGIPTAGLIGSAGIPTAGLYGSATTGFPLGGSTFNGMTLPTGYNLAGFSGFPTTTTVPYQPVNVAPICTASYTCSCAADFTASAGPAPTCNPKSLRPQTSQPTARPTLAPVLPAYPVQVPTNINGLNFNYNFGQPTFGGLTVPGAQPVQGGLALPQGSLQLPYGVQTQLGGMTYPSQPFLGGATVGQPTFGQIGQIGQTGQFGQIGQIGQVNPFPQVNPYPQGFQG